MNASREGQFSRQTGARHPITGASELHTDVRQGPVERYGAREHLFKGHRSNGLVLQFGKGEGKSVSTACQPIST